MRQIICIQLGQCGNQIGYNFWQTIGKEHSLDLLGYQNTESSLSTFPHSYYKQTKEKRFIPRAILADSEPGVLDYIRGEPLGKAFSMQNYVHGKNGASNNWAKGYYGQGARLIDYILDLARKQAEQCESLQGFQICHSLGGGTGSGLGSLLTLKIKQEFGDRILQNFSVFPSKKVSDTVVQPYNTILAAHHLIQNIEGCFVFDNQALYNICSRAFKLSSPSYGDLNQLISCAMSGVSSSLRFPGQMNADMRKMSTNLVPYPRMHFFMVSIAPLISRGSKIYRNLDVNQLQQQIFDGRNMMCGADPRHGRYLSAFIAFRGKISQKQIYWPYIVYGKNSSYFVEWIPNNIKASICQVSLENISSSATLIGNSTAIQEMFRKTNQSFSAMYKRKAFLHWYTEEGMDELEFSEALSNVQDLISEYQLYQDATAEEYDFEEQG